MNDDLSQAPPPASLRVAFFSDALPERNGTGAYYHDLLQQLAPRIEALEIFQPHADGPAPRISIPMPGDAGQRLAAPPLRTIRAACGQLKPQVIVVVTPGLYGLLGVWEAKRQGAMLLSAFHTDFEKLARMYWNPFSRFFVNLVLRSANRIVCANASAVLVNNDHLRQEVRRLGARRVATIGTPLSPVFMQRPAAPIAPQLQRVCFAGRLAPEKNVGKILDAAAELPELEFVIGGDGPLREALQARAASLKNVRFTGWLDRAALIEMIDSASLLLLPSAFETFGSVALEAMARGRPALVSASAGIHAWAALQPGLITLETPGDLAAALRVLSMRDAATWYECSARARSAALQLNEDTLSGWLQLLDGQLAAPSP
jgi:glycosyltransferase involved in cell wall biosynthesis